MCTQNEKCVSRLGRLRNLNVCVLPWLNLKVVCFLLGASVWFIYTHNVYMGDLFGFHCVQKTSELCSLLQPLLLFMR